MRLIYSILYAAALCFLFPAEFLKRPAGLRRRWLKEKLGRLPELDASLWIHAVSVGEVHAALPLVSRLRQRYPDLPIVLSTITDTGQAVAREKAPAGVSVVYLPFDITAVVRHAVRRVNPRILLIIETELWPNLIWASRNERIPVMMVNGRISPKSAHGYRRLRFFMRKVLAGVDTFCMQSERDAERISEIGADSSRVVVCGNFKFDITIPEQPLPWAAFFTPPVIVAGSTHPGEEELILNAVEKNRGRHSGLLLIIAPRHPERFREVGALLHLKGIPFMRRSELGPDHPTPDRPHVLLLDTVGELAAVYRIADIAIIGKSFIGLGGQNPLEPAYWGKPIICGPHMENFPFIRRFLDAGAAFVSDERKLAGTIEMLLAHPDTAKRAGQEARRIVREDAGAVDRAMAIIGERLQ